jgi:hypothetical protein
MDYMDLRYGDVRYGDRIEATGIMRFKFFERWEKVIVISVPEKGPYHVI